MLGACQLRTQEMLNCRLPLKQISHDLRRLFYHLTFENHSKLILLRSSLQCPNIFISCDDGAINLRRNLTDVPSTKAWRHITANTLANSGFRNLMKWKFLDNICSYGIRTKTLLGLSAFCLT